MVRKALILLSCLWFISCSAIQRPNQRPQPDNELSGQDRQELARLLQGETGSIEPELIQPKPIEVPLTEPVLREVRRFVGKERAFVTQGLERKEPFEHIIQAELDAKGLPRELINMAFVESGFKLAARSRAGAVGPWQFIRSTARHYGLNTRWPNDQRRDIQKSSKAAAAYLSDLYEQFGDWYLAIAAYNGGPTRVRKAVRRARTKNTFAIATSPVLRGETRKYVCRVLAMIHINRNLARYGFEEEARVQLSNR